MEVVQLRHGDVDQEGDGQEEAGDAATDGVDSAQDGGVLVQAGGQPRGPGLLQPGLALESYLHHSARAVQGGVHAVRGAQPVVLQRGYQMVLDYHLLAWQARIFAINMC